MRKLVIKNNPEFERSSCERWFDISDGNKLVCYMIKNGMCNKKYDIYIFNLGRWILIEKEDMWKICDKRTEKKFLKSYPPD